MILLVTCPQGREGDAILELEWALEKVKVHGTDWRGVLLAETPYQRKKRFEGSKILKRRQSKGLCRWKSL